MSGSASSVRRGNCLFDVDVVLERGRRGHGLEGRTRRVHLAPRPCEQRAVGVPRAGTRAPLARSSSRATRAASGRRSGSSTSATTRPGLHVEHDDRTAPAVEAGRGGRLRLRRHREHDRSRRRLARQGLGDLSRPDRRDCGRRAPTSTWPRRRRSRTGSTGSRRPPRTASAVAAGYTRWYLNSSWLGTDLASTIPSAVTISPRGRLMSRRNLTRVVRVVLELAAVRRPGDR